MTLYAVISTSTVVILLCTASGRSLSTFFIAAISRSSWLLSSWAVTTPSASADVNVSSCCTRSWMRGCSALSSSQLVRAMSCPSYNPLTICLSAVIRACNFPRPPSAAI